MTSTEQFRQANRYLKAGDRAAARRILQQAVRQDPENYKGWLWLASVTPSAAASLDYVARAAALRPGDPVVEKAHLWAQKRLEKEQMDLASASPPVRRRPRWLWAPLLLIAIALLGITLWQTVWAATPASSGMNSGTQISGIQLAAVGDSTPDPDPDRADATLSPAVTDLPILSTITSPPITATPPPHIAAKSIGVASADPLPTWTVTPTPTPTPTATPTIVPTFLSNGADTVGRPFGVGPAEKWIDINLTTQTLRAYEGDTLVFSTLISSGTWQHPTVTGQFRVWLRYQSQTMDGSRLGYDYYLENVPYVMYFYKDYAIHGTFWHSNFGTPMSHGCVNMETSEAEWIFNWSTLGTVVYVHY